MSNPNDYTVGWICAIITEYVAAQEFLDEEHDGPEYVSPNDNNHYTLGRVGRHNVVIAVLPDNEYGKSSAAGVARDMMHSFPNVRIGLMVGIGGGAPGKHDIRLGDVVVSSATSTGGVLGYDFGKDVQGHDFQVTGFLNQPPTILRTAMSGLKARYERKGHQLTEAVNVILNQNKRLRKKYKQPETASDQLFKSEVTHDLSCAAICRYDEANLVSRPERHEDEDCPVIHYGLIASADKLMKNALKRDKLSEEHNVLCFEMESAGLVNHFPCLVIRGICDYSDSHKNEEWQGYAAMVAAAYAKDLLYQIAPSRLEAERKVSDILSVLNQVTNEHRDISKEHRDIAKKQLQAQKDQAKERLTEEQQKCRQSFRLTTGIKDATYEWYKDRVEERVEDTCMWFLEHENFQAWLNQESGPLLVSADPGCGKSVLAKYLIDHVLPLSSTTCYFFFKDQDQNTIQQALCGIIHQLFSLKPCLIEHAIPQFRMDGEKLSNSTNSLWAVLRNAVQDPRAGSIIIVLDALDECADFEFVDLMKNIQGQFHSDSLTRGKLRYLLTCRPYDQILTKFQVLLKAFPNIHIPGEEESEAISQEVNRVIQCRIDQMAIERQFSAEVKSSLEQRLRDTSHRTYLWVYLVFDYLAEGNFKQTPQGIATAIASLPSSVNEAYDKILNKTNESPMVRKTLCIVLAASRPLTISEMNVAVNVDDTMQSMEAFDLEDDEHFKRRLRSWCGLFVSIHRGRIYFLHQTAREFLVADLESSTSILSGLRWHHSISTSQAHDVLANICVLYLNLFNSKASPSLDRGAKTGRCVNTLSFLNYSANNWMDHFRKADINDGPDVLPFVQRICDPSSESFPVWHDKYRKRTTFTPQTWTDLIIASYIGLPVIVKLLLDKGADIEARDSYHLQPSLLWAIWAGHEDVAKLLLERGANANTKDNIYNHTALHAAADLALNETIKLLLENGADIGATDSCDWTPLLYAVEKWNETTIELLLEQGADIDFMAEDGTSSLQLAAGIFGMVYSAPTMRLLVQNGAFLEHDNIDDIYTPLRWVSKLGDEATVRLLLDHGACIESRDQEGQTALSLAYREGHDAIVNLLIERGAKFDD